MEGIPVLLKVIAYMKTRGTAYTSQIIKNGDIPKEKCRHYLLKLEEVGIVEEIPHEGGVRVAALGKRYRYNDQAWWRLVT